MVERGWGAPPVPRWVEDDADDGIRRQARARVTRRALLLAAARLIDEHGYHGASLNDVAAAAGTTKGAVYFHFTAKRTLAAALFDEVATAWGALAARVVALGRDPLATLMHCYDAYTGGLMYDLPSRAAMRIIGETDLVGSAPWVPRWQRTVEDLLVRSADTGLLVPEVDPVWLSRLLPATAIGHFHLAEMQPGSASMWDRMTDTWSGLLPAIACEAWVAAWQASGWTGRPAPRLADYGGA